MNPAEELGSALGDVPRRENVMAIIRDIGGGVVAWSNGDGLSSCAVAFDAATPQKYADALGAIIGSAMAAAYNGASLYGLDGETMLGAVLAAAHGKMQTATTRGGAQDIRPKP